MALPPRKPSGSMGWSAGTQALAAGGVTCTRIALATVLAFILVRVSGMETVASYAAGFIPARVAMPNLLDAAGLPFPALPWWLTPLTATLLHGGWLHLGFNLLMLLFCGRQVEIVLGGRLILMLYVVGAYAAAAGQWLLSPMLAIPMIGASGAISAIIGVYALLYSGNKVRALGPIPSNVVRMLWLGGAWICVQFLIGLASSGGPGVSGAEGDAIAIGAHIGGFIAGMLMLRPLLRLRFGARRRES